MFLLAANAAIAISISNVQAARMPSRELAVWNQIRPGIVTLFANGKPTGVAALLDDSGYFVAHSSSVSTLPVSGTSFQGKPLSFSIVSQDRAAMLVLLKTTTWEPGTARPFRAPSAGEEPLGELIGVLPNGPMRMTFGSKHRLGVLNPSRRVVPLTEMRFEAAPQFVGGALIFSEAGELIGSLNATLGRQDENSQRRSGGAQLLDGATVNTNGSQSANSPSVQLGNQGPRGQQYLNAMPSDMTVAYTVSADFVRHVLDGFLSPSHTVEFAILGVFCTDAIGGGAQIQQVTAGSPADRVGLHPGDIMLNIASNAIADQLEFARVMLQQKVGKSIPVLVQRGPRRLLIDIVPAKAAD